MSYQIIMGETSQTFEDIGDAAERARSLSLEFGGSSEGVRRGDRTGRIHCPNNQEGEMIWPRT